MSLKKNKTLTAESFQKLLNLFHPDPDQAGLIYLNLRQKLINKFTIFKSASPEENADAVFDRVARKLEEGTAELDPAFYERYFFAVAKFVHRESYRAKKMVSIDDVPNLVEPSEDLRKSLQETDERIEKELKFTALEKCHETLKANEKYVFDIYFADGDDLKRKERRRLLAEKLRISSNSLKVRASRIITKLTDCVKKKLL